MNKHQRRNDCFAMSDLRWQREQERLDRKDSRRFIRSVVQINVASKLGCHLMERLVSPIAKPIDDSTIVQSWTSRSTIMKIWRSLFDFDLDFFEFC